MPVFMKQLSLQLLCSLNPVITGSCHNSHRVFVPLQFAVRCLNPELAPRISPYEGDGECDVRSDMFLLVLRCHCSLPLLLHVNGNGNSAQE